MAWPRNLVMVRHAQSRGNILTADERALSGMSSDRYPLTPHGRMQAAITGEYLKEKYNGFRVYYVSYYTRSRETMEVMFPDKPHYEDPRLAEATRGIWHTMTAAQVEERYPGETERKKLEGLYHYRPWGGENWPDIELRIHSFLGTLSRDYEDQDVVMVVHGHWLILFQRLIHRFSIAEAMERYKRSSFNNASITTYRGENQNGKSRLVLAEENFTPWENQL